MILDAQTRLSNAQAITATAVSTNIYDFGSARDSGPGEMLELFIRSIAAFTAAGAATLTITVETDDNSSFSSATVLVSSIAIPKASLTANTEQFAIAIPTKNLERYIRLNYTIATGPMTAGTLDAYAGILDRQANSL